MSDIAPHRLARSDFAFAAALTATLLVVYGGFWQPRGWGTSSRLLLTYALVQTGSIEVTPFVVADSGEGLRPNVQTRDLSSTDGRTFHSDKAPGQGFLGVPAAAAAIWSGLAPPYPPETQFTPRRYPTDYWITLGTSGLAAALTAALLYLMVRSATGLAISAAAAAVGYGLTTHALVYATLAYGHCAAGLFALLAVYGWYWRSSRTWAALAGAAAGMAVCIDYPLATLPAALGLWEAGKVAFLRGRGTVRLLCFVGGGLPLAVLLGGYHHAVTGSPFELPYRFEYSDLFAYHRDATIPLGTPDPWVVLKLLAGTKRGMALYCPVALVGLPCLPLAWGRCRGLAATVGLTFAGVLAVNAAFPAWDGGWSTGPRFLLPTVPLLILCAGLWMSRRPSRRGPKVRHWTLLTLVVAAAMVGGFMNATFGSADGRIPDAMTDSMGRKHSIDHPLRGYVWPRILDEAFPAPYVGALRLVPTAAGQLSPRSVYVLRALLTVIAVGFVLAGLVLDRRRAATAGTDSPRR